MKRFKRTYIEITNVCNLSCEFCPKTKRSPEFMDTYLFENILQQIKPFCEYIYFHVLGEPLLHPELETFLELSSHHGFKVNITTNGTLISKVQSKLISSPSIRQMNFSLHSFDANPLSAPDENYFQLMDNYLEDIFSFTKAAIACSDLIISYRLWNLEENTVHNDKNSYVLSKLEKVFNLEYEIKDLLVQERGIKIAPHVYLNQAERFKWPDLNDSALEGKGYCYGLRDQIAILADGTVVPCCLDGEGTIKLGNVTKESFSNIIENEKSRVIYNGFSNRTVVEELCRRCTYRKRFDT